MTLKDKFHNPIMRHDLGRNEIEETKEQCSEIAEDFAVGFCYWSCDKILITINDVDLFEYRFNVYSGKELLEIYKKEKGL